MNFGKLLGAGKSVMNGAKGAAYREDKRVYLPKFGSPKNPFATSPSPEVQSELPKPVSKNSLTSVTGSLPSETQTKVVQMPSSAPQQPVRVATWMDKLNPAALFRGPASVHKNAVPVQTELSLEKVKVVHNDLTDAEVEVVPLKSRPARVPPPDNPPAKKSWEILGEQIMKVTAL
jgi:hypothetical protein